MPEARSDASKLVRLAPLAAGNVAGNRASGIVPEARSDASKLVRLAPLIAGSVPVRLAAGRLVSDAPEPSERSKVPDEVGKVTVAIPEYAECAADLSCV